VEVEVVVDTVEAVVVDIAAVVVAIVAAVVDPVDQKILAIKTNKAFNLDDRCLNSIQTKSTSYLR
jgi:hypothetical protein